MPSSFPADGRIRVVIENVAPAVDGGRFPIKRVAGETVVVEADCFADGHDTLACRLRYRRDDARDWQFVPMAPLGNDRWRASFVVDAVGRYRYTITAWVDAFLSWRHDFARRIDADDLRIAAQVGASLLETTATRAKGADAAALKDWAARLRAETDAAQLHALAEDEARAAIAMRYPDSSHACTYPVEFGIVVDRERARFSSWYEMFPRSAAATPGSFTNAVPVWRAPHCVRAVSWSPSIVATPAASESAVLVPNPARPPRPAPPPPPPPPPPRAPPPVDGCGFSRQLGGVARARPPPPPAAPRPPTGAAAAKMTSFPRT